MSVFRTSRVVAALIAVVSVLFMQFAVASYACPVVKMDNCHGMDMEQPSLCHVHDQAGNQSLDKPPAPPVAPFVPATLVTLLVIDEPVQSSQADRADTFFLTRATAPPLAIRHCCFRI